VWNVALCGQVGNKPTFRRHLVPPFQKKIELNPSILFP
jgi:hypothetical protein